MHAHCTSWTHSPVDPYKATTGYRFCAQPVSQCRGAADLRADLRAAPLHRQAQAPSAAHRGLPGAEDRS
ncbi:hypothetical protein D3C72_2189080 [compost metagenome]